MNGAGTRKHSTTSSYDSRSGGGGIPPRPSAKAMLNGYDPRQPMGQYQGDGGTTVSMAEQGAKRNANIFHRKVVMVVEPPSN